MNDIGTSMICIDTESESDDFHEDIGTAHITVSSEENCNRVHTLIPPNAKKSFVPKPEKNRNTL